MVIPHHLTNTSLFFVCSISTSCSTANRSYKSVERARLLAITITNPRCCFITSDNYVTGMLSCWGNI